MKVKIRDKNETVDEVKIRIYADKIIIHKYYRTNPISHYQFTYNAEFVILDFEDFKSTRIGISSVKECIVKNLNNNFARVTLTGYIENISFLMCHLLEIIITDSINNIDLYETKLNSIGGQKSTDIINVNCLRLEQKSKLELIGGLCLDTLTLEDSDVEVILTCTIKYIIRFDDYKSKRIFSTDLRFKDHTDDFKQCVVLEDDMILIEDVFQCEKLLGYIVQDMV